MCGFWYLWEWRAWKQFPHFWYWGMSVIPRKLPRSLVDHFLEITCYRKVFFTSKSVFLKIICVLRIPTGNSLALQWIGLCAPTAGHTGAVPGQGIKIADFVVNVPTGCKLHWHCKLLGVFFFPRIKCKKWTLIQKNLVFSGGNQFACFVVRLINAVVKGYNSLILNNC